MHWDRPPYRITDAPEAVDLDVVHGFLAQSYWARGIPRAVVERAIGHSIPFSLHRGGRQVGFARVVSDRATFAYLADVFVVEAERGAGLGRWLVETAMAHPELQGLRRWLLVTRDAHGLYIKLGFAPPANASMILTRHDPDVYGR